MYLSEITHVTNLTEVKHQYTTPLAAKMAGRSHHPYIFFVLKRNTYTKSVYHALYHTTYSVIS